MLLGAVAFFCLAAWWTFGSGWFTPAMMLIGSSVLHFGLNWIIAYAAGRQLGEERQSGGFEVLLTTPLGIREIVVSQSKSLVVRFKGVWFTVCALDTLFIWAGAASGAWSYSDTTVYLLMWITLLVIWFGIHWETVARAMWISAWTGRPGYAATQAVLSNSWLFLLIGVMTPLAGAVALGAATSVVLLLAIAPIIFISRRQLKEKLIAELRGIACAPLPSPNEKRFRTWNPHIIFPPGM
jgi:hypothetical protein